MDRVSEAQLRRAQKFSMKEKTLKITPTQAKEDTWAAAQKPLLEYFQPMFPKVNWHFLGSEHLIMRDIFHIAEESVAFRVNYQKILQLFSSLLSYRRSLMVK